MYGCEMVWPLPIGSGWLRYASATCAAGTRRWRSTLASAARTAGDMLERPVSARVSAYSASTSETMRARRDEKS